MEDVVRDAQERNEAMRQMIQFLVNGGMEPMEAITFVVGETYANGRNVCG